MMEIKQNAPVSLIDRVSSNVGSKNTDDILDDKFRVKDSKDIRNGGRTHQNVLSDDFDDDLDFHDAVDTVEPITSDLEDALLAGDDNIHEAEKLISQSAETSDKCDSSTDPGDALDKLLSKIHEVVEDCEQPSDTSLKDDEVAVVNVNEISKHMSEPIEPMDVDASDNVLTEDHVTFETDIPKENEPNDGMIIDDDLSISKHLEKDEETEKEKGKEEEKENKIAVDELKEEKTELATETQEEKLSNEVENLKCTEKNKSPSREEDDEDRSKCNETKVREKSKDQQDKDKLVLNEEQKVTENESASEKEESNKKDEVAHNENSLEEGEIVDEDEGILTVNLDDDEDDVVVTSSVTKLKDVDPNEIVCLDDDDEDEAATASSSEVANKNNEQVNNPDEASKHFKEDNTKNLVTDKSSAIMSDNTDNACDGLNTQTVLTDEKEVNKTTSVEPDTTSQSSGGSSNLLQESKAPIDEPFEPRDDAEDEDAEAEVEGDVEDADDVELIEDDSVATKSNENVEKKSDAPPTKRLRFSEDNDNSQKSIGTENIKEKVQGKVVPALEESTNDGSVQSKVDEDSSTDVTASTVGLKRTFSKANGDNIENIEKVDKVSSEDEGASKKLKTALNEEVENDKVFNESAGIQYEVNRSAKEETDDSLLEYKIEPLIAKPSNKPILLYPPPKLDEKPVSVSLDFMSRFKKTFDQMTKNDLEELVLQKIVESLVHGNEFAELRLIIEKQENIIAMHRAKLAQLSKQYRDLEMVHTRVVKDMRDKNSHYLMPVRITRAVGLQVSSLPTRKDAALNTSTNSPSSTVASTPGSPQFKNSPNATANQQRLTSPQRTSSIGSLNQSSVNSNSTSTRRGCVQKVTAQRPVDSTSSQVNPVMSSIPASFLRPGAPKSQITANQISAPIPARVLNKNAVSPLPQNAGGTVRVRYGGNATASQPDQQRKLGVQQQGNSKQQSNTAVTNSSKANTIIPNKNLIQQHQQQYRRSESSPLPNVTVVGKTSSVMDQYKNSYNQSISNMPGVSITPARPKDKSVIDLTDEDDLTPITMPPAVNANVGPRVRVAPQMQVNNNRLPSLSRMPTASNVRPQIIPRQLSTMQAQRFNNVQQISTPAGTSITRVSVSASNPATQRLKYNHPAPLPLTPPQPFNPSWKLPPPRPTIRISNLENGIVISWTMEESMERHADCVTYQIYAYQETNAPPSVDSWRHVGDVKAMLLPMAVTLTQFQEDQRYYFAVRAVDIHQRFGAFSAPKTWN